MRVCQGSPPGPVHIEYPRNLSTAELSDAETGLAASSPVEGSSNGRCEGLDALTEAIRSCRRPTIVAGVEVLRARAGDELQALAERLGAAVLTSYKAKGVISEYHPLSAGVITGGRIERPVLEQADLVLLVGLDPVEMLGGPPDGLARVFSVTAHERAAEFIPASARCIGEIGPVLTDLRNLVGVDPDVGWTAGELAEIRADIGRQLDVSPGEGLAAVEVVRSVGESLPDALLTVDAGAHMVPAGALWRTRAPNEYLISNGFATMGFAVPAAIGAAIARPDRPVVAFTGDGGFAYHGSELETARRVGARTITIVFNDSSLSLIRVKQTARGGDRSRLDFGETRFDDIARGWGVEGVRVADRGALVDALEAASESDQSTVIDVVLSGAEYGRVIEAIRG